MILIADSGSSKTDWVVLEKNNVLHEFQCIGLNPNFLDDQSIAFEIQKLFDGSGRRDHIKMIFFYGSGCGNSINRERLRKILSEFFTGALNIEVETDMLGAARGICGGKEGIACILGTGSNSCLYNGKNISYQNPSFGYVFGDEGSGADIGKRTLQCFFERKFSPELLQSFRSWMKLSNDEIIEFVYRKPRPNRFIASITKFHSENLNNEELFLIREQAFSDFFEKQIENIPGAKSYSLNFTGSVAYFFREELQVIARQKKYEIGNINSTPKQGLINYHCR